MIHPAGETRQDRRRQWIVGLGIILIFVLAIGNLGQGYINYQSQTSHHATTVKQDKEILSLLQTVHNAQITNKGTLTDVAKLEQEVAAVIKGLPGADKVLITEAEAIDQQLMAVCAATNAHCPPLPPITGS